MCSEVMRLSLWVGLFPAGSSRNPIGPQSWGCANPPWLAQSPIQWKSVNSTAGSINFYVDTPQENLEFALFSNGTSYPVELVSTPLTMRDAHSPKHLRLARTQSPEEMRVSWSLLSLDKGAGSRVEWGLKSGEYSSYAMGTPSTYTKSDLCGPPATTHGWIAAPIFYSAVVTALPPSGTRVYYRVGSDSSGFSDERSFVSPMGANGNAVLRVTALADMGETYVDGAQYHWMEPYAINTTSFAIHKWEHADWEGGHIPLALNTASRQKTMSGKEGAPKGRVMSQLARRAAESNGADTPDVVLHIGDLSYATGYASEWDRFSERLPYHAVCSILSFVPSVWNDSSILLMVLRLSGSDDDRATE